MPHYGVVPREVGGILCWVVGNGKGKNGKWKMENGKKKGFNEKREAAKRVVCLLF